MSRGETRETQAMIRSYQLMVEDAAEHIRSQGKTGNGDLAVKRGALMRVSLSAAVIWASWCEPRSYTNRLMAGRNAITLREIKTLLRAFISNLDWSRATRWFWQGSVVGVQWSCRKPHSLLLALALCSVLLPPCFAVGRAQQRAPCSL
jgi:hypothetical protein